jgi:tRNA-dependent cyclodipeptide synthase
MNPAQYTNHPLTIKACWGVDASELAGLNAYLGVSFSKTTYFSRHVMRRYVEWACNHCRNLLIIVADHLEAHNVVVFKGLPHQEAVSRTQRTGAELLRAYRKAVPPELASRVDLVLASDLLSNEACADLVDSLRQLRDSSAVFAEDLRRGVQVSLGGKLRDAGLAGSTTILNRLSEYLIEELAIILYVSALAPVRYDLSVFPYRPQDVIIRSHMGIYGDRLIEITGGRPFRAIELAFSCEQGALDRVACAPPLAPANPSFDVWQPG